MINVNKLVFKLLNTIMAICMMLVFIAGCQANYRNEDNSDYKIPELNFDEIASPLTDVSNAEIVWNTDVDDVGLELFVFKKSNNHIEVIIDNLIKKYNLIQIDTNLPYTNGNIKLTVSEPNSVRLDISEGDNNVELGLSNDDIKVMADQALDNLGVDISKFKLTGFDKYEIGNGNSSYVWRKDAVYHQYINEYEVVGNSYIKVAFSKNDIISITISYSDLIPDLQIPTISLEEIDRKIHSEDIHLLTTQDMAYANRIEINQLEIVYVEHSYNLDEEYAQPCYRLTGKMYNETQSSEFTILVRAIPDKYTK